MSLDVQKKQNLKKRILCLHGYCQSGEILQKKTGAFRKILRDCEFIYITAPNKNESISSITGEDVYMWWETPENEYFTTCSHYVGIDNSLEFIKQVFKTQGPFDGILGFSQGGVFASILCGYLGKSDSGISFQFALIFSAFASSVKQFIELYGNIPPTLPTLHAFGSREKDTIVDPDDSKKLASYFPKDSTTVYEHKGGHYIPTTSESKQVYKNWIDPLLKAK
eukprot:TRINITY_DN11303_c0_g1_i1.p1 TRINITY_DN11303_c0_g1~~TRINITY_DN11303_c0_g1_i1.p1  ORF type:complete len:223 (-),score=34.02 TRINITY_DN11303_c0_g1_i1:96-764(-)